MDDDPQVRVFLKRVLEREGYEVDTAENGVEAWEALNEVAYTLLITDHHMPRMTGWELVAKARRFQMDIAIIMMSGLFDARTDPDWERLAIAGFFPKPFTITKMLDAVNQIHAVDNDLGRGSAPPSPKSNVPRFSNMQPYNHGGINE